MIASFMAQRCAATLLAITLGVGCAVTPSARANVAPKPVLQSSAPSVAPASTVSPTPPREPPTWTLSASALFAELEAKRTGAVQPISAAPSADPAEEPEPIPDDPEWPERCRGLVNYSEGEQMESCALTLHGNGSALVLHIVSGCGGDSCEVVAWVYTQALGRFVQIPGDVGGTLAADPNGRFLLLDDATDLSIPHEGEAELRDPFGGKDELITAKLELPSMTKTPFAACFSPSLSPGGRWFVCRNRAGDVLKVPIEGGTPKLVVKSGVAKDDLRWVLYAYGYPEAVEFIGAARLRYRLEIQSRDGIEEREAPWSE